MRTIFVPPHAGVLSAVGLAITSERREKLISVLQPAAGMTVANLAQACARAAHCVTSGEGWARDWTARMRYVGQGYELDVPLRDGDDGVAIAARFAQLHERRNGFSLAVPTEVIGIRYTTSGPAHPASFGDAPHERGATVDGPSIVMLDGATLRIAKGWSGAPHHTGGWLLTRTA